MFTSTIISRFKDLETPFYYYDMGLLRQTLVSSIMVVVADGCELMLAWGAGRWIIIAFKLIGYFSDARQASTTHVFDPILIVAGLIPFLGMILVLIVPLENLEMFERTGLILRSIISSSDAGIISGAFVSSTDNLGFDDDTALAWPLPGRVADFPINMFSLSAASRELACSPHSGFGDALQHCILGHRHDIFEFGLGVQKLQHGRMCETAIQAYTNPYSRKMVTSHPQQTSRCPFRNSL